MASTPIAYNTGSLISGTLQVGDLAIGITEQNYGSNIGGVKWWMGPNEEIGYVIAIPYSGSTQPTPIPNVSASVGFFRSINLTATSFISISNYIGRQNGQPPFTTATQAQNWLINNGYWTSYPSPSGSFFLLTQDENILTTQNGDQIEIQY